MFILLLNQELPELLIKVVVRLLLGVTEIGEAQAMVTCGRLAVTMWLGVSPGGRRSIKYG
jgi:hypothetical protein